MIRFRSKGRRRGGVTIWVVLLILPLFALVAFAVDLNYIWTVDAELQSAADAAALAGAEQLLGPNTVACLPNTSPSNWDALEQEADKAAVSAAKARAATETTAGAPVVLNDADVKVGYIKDPSSGPNTAAGAFDTSGAEYFPNSVQVTVHLDKTVPAGPLSLCFGPILGTPSVVRLAKATASLRGQNVTGFNGSGCRLLPIAMGMDAHNILLGTPTDPSGNIGFGLGGLLSILNLLNLQWLLWLLFPPPQPPGVTFHDAYTVTLPIAGGAQPPANVAAGGDGIFEAHVSPNATTQGDFYLVSLRNAAVTDDPTYVNWILNGPSKTDLATFGPNGLQASAAAPATMYAGPNLDSNMDAALKSVVGQTRLVPVFSSYSSTGGTYKVIGFTAVVVVAVNLQGLNPYIVLQPTATVDPSATLGGGASVGDAAFVYQSVSLSR